MQLLTFHSIEIIANGQKDNTDKNLTVYNTTIIKIDISVLQGTIPWIECPWRECFQLHMLRTMSWYFFGNSHHIKRQKTVTITARRNFVQVQPLTRSTYRQQIFSRPTRPYQVCRYNFIGQQSRPCFIQSLPEKTDVTGPVMS